ncbi:hypothetical protein M3649_04015 [Ureibacillus chungkukjangi]|uniref:hypothetical protein n=1 Tax=Ureibacillus chungkukjangi TaxID=1202712 RepID=UPI00203A542C|nr:hypothetical protein [Ureibacillus chungkukjangi]MCM3387298.1 hypothetical protein [Ureibacillus chungkukjangi]
MIDILVTYDNGDFMRTQMNCTLLEAGEYYINQSFTFGTSEENEYQVIAINIYPYDEWKHGVLEYFSANGIVVLNLDDDREQLNYKTKQNQYSTLTYEQVNKRINKYPIHTK